MKCKIFAGSGTDAIDAFNKWAEGKALTRDVLIHEHVLPAVPNVAREGLVIIVYHPESPVWDSTKSKPIQRVQSETDESTRLEREGPLFFKIPIHDKPEPHIKVEESQVTA